MLLQVYAVCMPTTAMYACVRAGGRASGRAGLVVWVIYVAKPSRLLPFPYYYLPAHRQSRLHLCV